MLTSKRPRSQGLSSSRPCDLTSKDSGYEVDVQAHFFFWHYLALENSYGIWNLWKALPLTVIFSYGFLIHVSIRKREKNKRLRPWRNISNTRKSVSSDIQTPRSRLKKRGAAEFFYKRLRGVWISDETRFRVFDMASQVINNSWRNSRLKLAKSYGN